jgi:DNA-binding PadR family transcriptional regulator
MHEPTTKHGLKTERLQTNSEAPEVLRHFEYAVISAVAELGPNAYPAEITRYLSKVLERRVALAQVFVALERLEGKGLVRSRELWPEPVRGGRRRRLFQMEASGARAIRNTAAVFQRAASSGQPEGALNASYEGATS